ncbi:MAG: BON domain-containing protein [Burkholderiaceae bacterium]|nr:BON domain-containing protein [Rhodoferax sp.]MCP5270858.1 BON domain-containing protein [Burkholderiaceae bacterium]
MTPRPTPTQRRPRRAHPAIAIVAAAALATLAACGAEEDPRTAGQQLDDAVAAAKVETQAAGDRIAQEAREARAEIGETVTDARITAAVNARLASDTELSALRIDVDTEAGHVVLDGEAPSPAAKARAEQLARDIDGVLGVDNRLTVRAG